MYVSCSFNGKVIEWKWKLGVAGAGSLILEFATLSRLTGDDRFEKAAYRVR
jgi:hypothetical protein